MDKLYLIVILFVLAIVIIVAVVQSSAYGAQIIHIELKDTLTMTDRVTLNGL